jgi:hypothetical protein
MKITEYALLRTLEDMYGLPPVGHSAALMDAPGADRAVLEVDEGHLPRVVLGIRPATVVLLIEPDLTRWFPLWDASVP